MKKYDIVIGIDPDREKSGVATLWTATAQMSIQTLPFPDLVDYLGMVKEGNGDCRLLVVVEAGWMIPKSNYHPMQGRRAEKIAHDVGANHETGKKIIEMCQHMGISTREQHPLKKVWRGKDGKITAAEFQALTGWQGRCNQDGRDAGLIAWYAGEMPMIMRY